MKTVIVSGGAGFIGSNLALELESQGYKVIVIDNFLKGNKKNLEGFNGTFLQGAEDVLDTIEDDVYCFFHQGAITDTTIQDKKEMFDNNVEGFKKILAFCKKKNAKLVYASSAAVYGDGTVPMQEDQEKKPLNIYAESKLEMDKLAQQEQKNLPTIVGLRYFNVFGPREGFKGKMASMIYQLANQMKQGNRPRVFKYGDQERDHVYVKDIVAQNIKAMEFDGFGIFNAATGQGTSFNKIIEVLNKALNTSLEPDYFDNPYTGKYQDKTVADMSKAKDQLGHVPHYTIETGIKDYLGWLEENEWSTKNN